VAGSLLIGHPGDEYMCRHDHVFGYECLPFALAPALVETSAAGLTSGGPAAYRPSPN